MNSSEQMAVPNLQDFIEKVYQEPWSPFRNNCFRKSLKIVRKAQELGKEANLVLCWTIARQRRFGGFPTIQPHMYTEVEGQKVDVTFDPISEEIHCQNSEQIILLPFRLPKLVCQYLIQEA